MASQLVAGRVGVKPNATGQDEMALKRKYTKKTRAEREFLKLPGANFISSITVHNGITTLSA